MDFKFSPSDFSKLEDDYSIHAFAKGPTTLIAEQANAKLAEWLSRGVKVYGYRIGTCPDLDWRIEDYRNGSGQSPTHEALLINIRELQPKSCEHQNIKWAEDKINGFFNYVVCADCGHQIPTGVNIIDENGNLRGGISKQAMKHIERGVDNLIEIMKDFVKKELQKRENNE